MCWHNARSPPQHGSYAPGDDTSCGRPTPYCAAGGAHARCLCVQVAQCDSTAFMHKLTALRKLRVAVDRGLTTHRQHLHRCHTPRAVACLWLWCLLPHLDTHADVQAPTHCPASVRASANGPRTFVTATTTPHGEWRLAPYGVSRGPQCSRLRPLAAMQVARHADADGDLNCRPQACVPATN